MGRSGAVGTGGGLFKVVAFLIVTGSLSVSLSEESKCFGVLKRK